MEIQTPNQREILICAACHAKGLGCCRLGAEGVTRMFGLTRGEVDIMARASGLKPEEFVIADQVSSQFLTDLAAIHPVFLKTLPEGRRLRLKVEPDGSCVFLGPKGCRLPMDARPLYCRLYPFWFTEDGRLMVLISKNCLAQKDARSWQEVLARLGETQDHLRQLFTRLKALAAGHQFSGLEGKGVF
jgi:Fe-S-cluster containining protein